VETTEPENEINRLSMYLLQASATFTVFGCGKRLVYLLVAF